MKTVINKILIRVSVSFESGVFGPDAVKTIQMPIIPKSMDE
jgi:hypothetical protein